MLDKRKQISNVIIYMLPMGVGTILPFITIPIFTRILTPGDYGILALFMIYASICNGFVNLGLTSIFERNYFQYKDSPEKISQLFFL